MKLKYLFTLSLVGLLTVNVSAQKIRIKTGLEVLKEQNFKILEGKRVGLITNPTGVDNDLKSTIDILHVLIGFWCGELLMSVKDNGERIQRLFLVGTVLTFSGLLLSYGCPISKKIWSPTFVLTTWN